MQVGDTGGGTWGAHALAALAAGESGITSTVRHFFLAILHIIQLTPHKLSAELKNRPTFSLQVGDTGGGTWGAHSLAALAAARDADAGHAFVRMLGEPGALHRHRSGCLGGAIVKGKPTRTGGVGKVPPPPSLLYRSTAPFKQNCTHVKGALQLLTTFKGALQLLSNCRM